MKAKLAFLHRAPLRALSFATFLVALLLTSSALSEEAETQKASVSEKGQPKERQHTKEGNATASDDTKVAAFPTSNETGNPSPSPVDEPSQEDANKKEAKERYAKGLRFADEGDFSLALIEFERAYQLVPDYRVLYNVGQVAILLGRFARARIALTRYLEEGDEELGKERREAVRADLAMLEARTAEVTVLSKVEGAHVVVDNILRGETPLDGPLILDAGDHRITVEKSGFESESRHRTLAGADVVTLSFSLKELPKKDRVIVVQKDPQEPRLDSGPSPQRAKKGASPWLVTGWVATGSFAGGAVIAALLGLDANRKAKQIEESPDPDASAYTRHRRSAKSRYLAADLLTIGAVVTGATTLYFTLRSPRKDKKLGTGSLHVGISASHISLTQAFH